LLTPLGITRYFEQRFTRKCVHIETFKYAQTEIFRDWNLSNFTELQKPILIGDINSKKDEILQLMYNLEIK
jgi:hypothetical protein